MAKTAPKTKAVAAKPTKADSKAIKKEKPEPKKVAAAKKAAAPAPEKKAAASKKEPEPPVLSLKKSTSKKTEVPEPAAKKGAKSSTKKLDLCLLMDCTGSMASWIERSKNTLKEIIDTVKSGNEGLEVRVCFVGYRDIRDNPRFSIQEFSDDLEKVKKFISTVNASGGADFPEDV